MGLLEEGLFCRRGGYDINTNIIWIWWVYWKTGFILVPLLSSTAHEERYFIIYRLPSNKNIVFVLVRNFPAKYQDQKREIVVSVLSYDNEFIDFVIYTKVVY